MRRTRHRQLRFAVLVGMTLCWGLSLQANQAEVPHWKEVLDRLSSEASCSSFQCYASNLVVSRNAVALDPAEMAQLRDLLAKQLKDVVNADPQAVDQAIRNAQIHVTTKTDGKATTAVVMLEDTDTSNQVLLNLAQKPTPGSVTDTPLATNRQAIGLTFVFKDGLPFLPGTLKASIDRDDVNATSPNATTRVGVDASTQLGDNLKVTGSATGSTSSPMWNETSNWNRKASVGLIYALNGEKWQAYLNGEILEGTRRDSPLQESLKVGTSFDALGGTAKVEYTLKNSTTHQIATSYSIPVSERMDFSGELKSSIDESPVSGTFDLNTVSYEAMVRLKIKLGYLKTPSCRSAAQTLTEEERSNRFAAARRNLDQHRYCKAAALALEDGSAEALLVAVEALVLAEDYRQLVALAETISNASFSAEMKEKLDFAYAQALYRLATQDPELDQGRTLEAQKSLFAYLMAYRQGPHAADAVRMLQASYEQLAMSELKVGQFYLKQGQYPAALGRFENVVGKFPNSTVVPQALASMARSYRESRQPEAARQILEFLSSGKRFASGSGHADPGRL